MKLHALIRPRHLLVLQLASGLVSAAYAEHNPYTFDQTTSGTYLNSFWTRYGMSEGPADANGNPKVIHGSSGWFEWNALKVAWTNHRPTEYTNSANWIKNAWLTGFTKPGTTTLLPATPGHTDFGFVWSSNQDNQGRWMQGNYGFMQWHYDQLPRYICAIYQTYMWGRNINFLNAAMPKARAAMYFMLNTMQGNNGLLICSSTDTISGTNTNNGLSATSNVIATSGSAAILQAICSGGTPSTYMDNVRSGYKDGWINAVFYTALLNMADLEDLALNSTGTGVSVTGSDNITRIYPPASTYRSLAATLPQTFSTELWEGNRFAGWKDSSSLLHGGGSQSIGYTYVNIEALSRGLGTPWRANMVFDWLDSKTAQPTIGGAYVNTASSTDVYQTVIAPRTVTARIPDKDFCEWTMTGRYSGTTPNGQPFTSTYGNHMQDGGSILFYNYYDVMARLLWRDADDAYTKLTAMLYRCALEPGGFYMSNGQSGTTSWRPYNGYGDYYLAVGTSSDYPESGISGLSMLYGFMGVQATKDGLNITPKLPSRMLFAQCADTYFNTTNRTIRIDRGAITQELVTSTGTQTMTSGTDSLSQTFTSANSFNELGVYLGNYKTAGSRWCDISLYTSGTAGLYDTKVATRRLVAMEDNAWAYFTFPYQPAGNYRVVLSNVTGPLDWYFDANNNWGTGNDAQVNGSTIAGGYCLRIINTFLNPTPVIESTNPNWYDVCPRGGLLSATFTPSSTFSRVSVGVNVPTGPNADCRLKLERKLGTNQYHTVATQYFNQVMGDCSLTLTLADQPPGEYTLTMDSNTVGTMRWRRNSQETNSQIGNTTRITSSGTTTVFTGDQIIKVERGQYKITLSSTVTGTSTATVDAGDTFQLSITP